MTPIPQCDPHASYLAQRSEIDAALARALDGGRYILGPEVAAFEQEFAAFCGGGLALGVANGTDALAMALQAAGLGGDDAVATVSHTAVATVVAIRAIGAHPLLVDVTHDEGTMDPAQLAQVIASAQREGRKLSAVVPVHLYGRGADLPAIAALAEAAGAALVEDCAQAHGAVVEGRQVGSWGRTASYSFYPTKNLGAFGDGGAVLCRDPETRERARLLREYGWRTRYISDVEGGNSRLDELQAALLRVKLQVLAEGNERRRAIAHAYYEGITNPALWLPPRAPEAAHVYHQFVVRTPHREALRAWLAEQGIGTLVHYPVPVHLQPAYTDAAYRPLPLPRTEAWAREVLSLPMFPELPAASVARVIEALNRWVAPAA